MGPGGCVGKVCMVHGPMHGGAGPHLPGCGLGRRAVGERYALADDDGGAVDLQHVSPVQLGLPLLCHTVAFGLDAQQPIREAQLCNGGTQFVAVLGARSQALLS